MPSSFDSILLLAVALGAPATVRAFRIARLHRQLGGHAWRLIFAADYQSRFGEPRV
jgi:hypothetical protein